MGLTLCFSLPALAQPARDLTLEWTAPNQCPQQARVLQEVNDALAGSEHPDRPLRVRASVVATADGFRAQLEFSDDDDVRATRTLSDAACGSLTSASALVIAIAIDPGVAERRIEAPAPKPAPAKPPTTPQPAAAPASPPQPTAAVPEEPASNAAAPVVALELGAGLVLHSGMLPFFAEGAFGALGLRLRALRAELSGSALPAQLQRAPQTSRVDTHLSLVGAALHVGYDWHFGVL
ncbi:MAG TPA: hypothetical protein VF331_21530, partial [Polyangiales bacterium]